jgi:hypothetical protein
MPTVLRVGSYRFFFYSADGTEPPHTHVERDDALAKFWLKPVRLARSGGMNRVELTALERTVSENAPKPMEAWNDFFGA